jgi:1-aminocyclopropane-1-carboxylate deaminase
MDFQHDFKINCQLLSSDLYCAKGLQVYLVRSDESHVQVSGNKWYKLKYSLIEAKALGCKHIVSFGGAYSNHIHALAYAAASLGISVTAYIRGQWSEDNQTLRDAKKWGMQLIPLTRAEYREKTSSEFLKEIYARFPNCLIIPEGGSNKNALRGVAELTTSIENELPSLDYLITACGTGGTLAGLISGAVSTNTLLGIPVLKGAGFIRNDVQALLDVSGIASAVNWQLDLDGHYGGYGKVKTDHLKIMTELEQHHDVVLEPVYVAKMWRRFDELVAADYFVAGMRIAMLHSGGLQGRRGFNL